MIIDYFPVLFSTVLFSTLLHCHYFNKIMQLEKGVFSCWVLENVTRLLFLVNGSPEKGCFPHSLQCFTIVVKDTSWPASSPNPILCWRYKLPQIRIHVPYLHHWVTNVELIPPPIKELAEGFKN